MQQESDFALKEYCFGTSAEHLVHFVNQKSFFSKLGHRLDHPNIVKPLLTWQHNTRFGYSLMPEAYGDLTDYIYNRWRREDKNLEWMSHLDHRFIRSVLDQIHGLSSALDAIHGFDGLYGLHGGLDTHNILVWKDCEATSVQFKISGFGNSRSCSFPSPSTSLYQDFAWNNLRFHAPDKWARLTFDYTKGKFRSDYPLTQASEVFALGGVFLEILVNMLSPIPGFRT